MEARWGPGVPAAREEQISQSGYRVGGLMLLLHDASLIGIA